VGLSLLRRIGLHTRRPNRTDSFMSCIRRYPIRRFMILGNHQRDFRCAVMMFMVEGSLDHPAKSLVAVSRPHALLYDHKSTEIHGKRKHKSPDSAGNRLFIYL